MQSVNVKVEKLLEKVKENRDNHRAVFEAALEVFKVKVVEELEAMLERARKGERVAHSHGLMQPMDMTREYDQAIAMLEMSVDEEIEVTHQEFAQFVLDQWHWKQQFVTSNAAYFADSGRDIGATGQALDT
jgi:hypothetical protein